jgi:putative membrane protein
MKKIILTLLGIAATLGTKAQIPQPDPDTTARHFLIVASIGNLQEVSAGRLAEQMGHRSDVRSFGKMMVDDHSQAQQKLLQLAKRKGINIPPMAANDIQADLKLKNANDTFDNVYVHAMVAGHRNTIQTFETYAATGKDPDVKAFAKQTLPTLKAHLNAIQTIDQQLVKTK